MWEYFKNLYTSKHENKEEIGKFLGIYDQSKLNQEDTNNINRPIVSNENDIIVKNFPKKKSPSHDEFTVEFYHTIF
jgi:hypothetical protein